MCAELQPEDLLKLHEEAIVEDAARTAARGEGQAGERSEQAAAPNDLLATLKAVESSYTKEQQEEMLRQTRREAEDENRSIEFQENQFNEVDIPAVSGEGRAFYFAGKLAETRRERRNPSYAEVAAVNDEARENINRIRSIKGVYGSNVEHAEKVARGERQQDAMFFWTTTVGLFKGDRSGLYDTERFPVKKETLSRAYVLEQLQNSIKKSEQLTQEAKQGVVSAEQNPEAKLLHKSGLISKAAERALILNKERVKGFALEALDEDDFEYFAKALVEANLFDESMQGFISERLIGLKKKAEDLEKVHESAAQQKANKIQEGIIKGVALLRPYLERQRENK